MKLYEIITVFAIIAGPILAVQAEKYLQRKREDKNRRLSIFKTLMATRGSSLSFAHVEALNRIDLEFSNNKRYTKVISAWKEYFDNLGQKAETDEQLSIWIARNEELLANLLYEMGQSLGYSFDKVLIKRNIYSPVGHERTERENQLIRKGLLDVLNGDKVIPITYIVDEQILQKQSDLQNAMLVYYQTKVETN
jgi:hypothetical protein